jgi:peptidoglycan-associated lipoprotein
MKKSLLVLGLVMAIAGCRSDGSESAMGSEIGGAEYDNVKVVLPDPIEGIKEGSKEDLEARAGIKVYFDLNKSDIKPEARNTLRKQALWFKAYPAVKAMVEGHCDERGTREYNQALGEKRASAVRSFLVATGVDAKRLKVISYGKEKPEVAGANEEAYAKNRRAVTAIR